MINLVAREKNALTVLLIANDAQIDLSETNPNRKRRAMEACIDIGAAHFGSPIDMVFLTSAMQKINASTFTEAIYKAEVLEKGGDLKVQAAPDPKAEMQKVLAERERIAQGY